MDLLYRGASRARKSSSAISIASRRRNCNCGSELCSGGKGFLPLLSFGISGFALETTLREFWEPAQIRAQRKGESFLKALWESMKRTRRRTGGYIVHIGVIMIAVAVTGSSAFKTQKEFVLKPGETVQMEEYELTYLNSETKEESHRFSRIAVVQATKNGRDLGVLEPKLNNYFRMANSTIGTPAVKTTLKEDLYLNFRILMKMVL